VKRQAVFLATCRNPKRSEIEDLSGTAEASLVESVLDACCKVASSCTSGYDMNKAACVCMTTKAARRHADTCCLRSNSHNNSLRSL